MPAEFCLTGVANRTCVKIVINQTGVYLMPISLPDTYPAEIVVDVPSIRFPPGTGLIVGWAVVMLAVGFYATFVADVGAMDQFQLQALF
jgi:hypothetical protein